MKPTGNLDVNAGGEIVRLLRDLTRQEEGVTILMVTHNLENGSSSDAPANDRGGRL